MAVLNGLPRFQVRFSELPSQLLCGEVRRATLEVRNGAGCPPLHSLLVASAQPQWFCLCAEQEAYQEEPLLRPGEAPPTQQLAHAPALSWARPILAPEGGSPSLLEGGQVVRMPFWLRGAEKPGRHVLRLLFYYQGPSPGQLT